MDNALIIGSKPYSTIKNINETFKEYEVKPS
jgi:hypothetical protein